MVLWSLTVSINYVPFNLPQAISLTDCSSCITYSAVILSIIFVLLSKKEPHFFGMYAGNSVSICTRAAQLCSPSALYVALLKLVVLIVAVM